MTEMKSRNGCMKEKSFIYMVTFPPIVGCKANHIHNNRNCGLDSSLLFNAANQLKEVAGRFLASCQSKEDVVLSSL